MGVFSILKEKHISPTLCQKKKKKSQKRINLLQDDPSRRENNSSEKSYSRPHFSPCLNDNLSLKEVLK